MGGKRGGTSQAPIVYQQSSNAYDASMMEFYKSMLSNSMKATQSTPTVDDLDQEEVSTIDWEAKQEELKEKLLNTTKSGLTNKGRQSTILTDPLSNEEIVTTSSVLTGK